MRFKEYTQTELDFGEIDLGNDGYITKSSMEILEKECSQILDIYKKNKGFIFRGITRKYAPNRLYKITPRADRKPKDTNPIIHKFVDDFFEERVGWRPRSEGIFCTPRYHEATSYGHNAYIVFPKDGFKYLWSPNIEDLYCDVLSKIQTDTMLGYGKSRKQYVWYDVNHWKGDEDYKEYDNLKDIPGYRTHIQDRYDVNQVTISLKSGEELIARRKPVIKSIDAIRDQDLEEIRKELMSYDDSNIGKLIDKNRNEIMIKCDYYYIFRTPSDWSMEELRTRRFFNITSRP